MKSNSRTITPGNTIEVISEHLLADVFPVVLDLDRSHGNYIFDSKGRRFLLDCFSFIASNPIGHNHPKLNEPEFEKKLLRAAKTRPSNSDIYTTEMAEFVSTFARIALPASHPHLFFIDGGTLGVENALKIAMDWKVRLNFKRGRTEELGGEIIHFRDAFHGRSGYSISMTNTADPRKTKYFPKFPWPRVSNPKIRYPLEGENLRTVQAAEEESLQEIRSILEERGEHIAAIILEPIQGEGGDNHFRPEFHQALRALADQYPVMLIYDEVQSGVGLTGAMWAYQHYGMAPDVVAFGKKTQVCGCFANTRVDEVENNVFQERSRINSTWGGNLVDMVRSQRYFEIIEEDRLVENAARVGEILLSGLHELSRRYPGTVSNARGKGLMCAFDISPTEKRAKIIDGAMERGAIVIACGTTSIRLRPSLTFSEKEVGELLSIFEDTIKKTT